MYRFSSLWPAPFIGFLTAVLVLVLSITQWRVYAFKNVTDIQVLKQRAIKETLLWQTDNWFHKMEYVHTFYLQFNANRKVKKLVINDLDFNTSELRELIGLHNKTISTV